MSTARRGASPSSTSLLFICVWLIGGESAFAQESGGGYFVAGGASLPEYEGADDGRIVPFLVGRGDVFSVDVELEGLRARADLLDHSFWRAGPALGVVLPRNESFVDEPTFALIEEIDVALELGAFIGFEQSLGRTPEDRLSGAVAVRQDVLGAHNGFVVTPEIEYFFKVNRMLRVGVGANATWANGDYQDAYFSVDASDAAASGLAAFQADAGLKDVGVELYNILSFSEKWGVFSRFAYNRLLGDAADSPLVAVVGSEDQIFYGAGVFYRW